MARPPRDERERFIEKTAIQTDGCHLWTAQIMRDGYGRISFRGRTGQPAHRVAYILFRGEIPAGLCVLHKCDVRNCVNPDHLFLGTKIDNVKDMDAKGRRRSPPTRLYYGQFLMARAMLAVGFSQQYIADMFDVHQTVISRIKLHKILAFN